MLLHYRLVEKIGEGGMGVVWKAVDTKLDREVAIKVLPEAFSRDPERLGRFKREAKAVAALNHPNIVTVHSVEHDPSAGSGQGVHWITMELVHGETLTELIPKNGLPLGRFFEISATLAEAISAAHEQGITHRDLKPDNVMVAGDGRLKVLDFGLAKLREEARGPDHPTILPTATVTQEGKILGTVSYMSPEQAEGKPVDHRSDIFSLGVMLYQMATGRRPFEGDSSAAILASILNETPSPVTEVKPALPRHLGRIVRRCLQKDPDRRLQTAKDVRNELEELQQDVSSGVLDVPASAAPRRSVPRIVGGAVLGTAALAAVVYSVFLRGVEQAPATLEIKPLTSIEGAEGQPTWSPDGSFVAYYWNGPESRDVYVMASTGGDPIKLTDGPSDSTTPRWSPDGRHIAFLSERGGAAAVYLIPPLGGRARELVGLETTLLDAEDAMGSTPWSPDGTELLFPRGGALWKIDIETGEEVRLTDSEAPETSDEGASRSFDGERIVFTRTVGSGPRGLWLLPAGGGEPRPLVVDEHDNHSPAWSLDGRKIVFSSDRGRSEEMFHLWEVEIGSGRLRQLTTGLASDTAAVVGHHGRLAYSQFYEDSDVYLSRLTDLGQERLTSHRGGSYGPRISPDGGRVAYGSNRTGVYSIWVLDLETKSEQQLFGALKLSNPDWSPEGREIVFFSSREGQPDLWVASVDRGAPRRLVTNVNGRHPKWSPDGRAIAYVVGNTLWAVDANGENPRILVQEVEIGPDWFGQFGWYLDSRRAIFSRPAAEATGDPEMVVTDLETGREVTLFRGPYFETVVAPDGRAVAFNLGTHPRNDLWVLRLDPPETRAGLPRPVGQPERLTDARGRWHPHAGGWFPDGERIAYSYVVSEADILVIENYR